MYMYLLSDSSSGIPVKVERPGPVFKGKTPLSVPLSCSTFEERNIACMNISHEGTYASGKQFSLVKKNVFWVGVKGVVTWREGGRNLVKRVKVAEICNGKATGEGTAKKGKETRNTDAKSLT